MTRDQLEHILRASGAICGAPEIVVIGSQAILGSSPDAPPELRDSIEADVFTFRDPNDAQLIDGSIGEDSPFHRTFGYYAHGVARETATVPPGWESRLVRVAGPNTHGVVGLCLDACDLALSKLVAGREKDLSFIAAMIRHRLVDANVMHTQLRELPIDDTARTLATQRLARLRTL